MAGERILILEDDRLLADVLGQRFRQEGWDSVVARSVTEARSAMDAAEPDVALCDVRLPDGSGVDLLRESAARTGTAFVMMTAHATVGSAVEALKLGAKDYLEKPFTLERAVATVRAALELTALRREVSTLREKSSIAGTAVLGESPAMKQVFALLERLASADTATVLIEGESGTGKGAVAQALHRLGRRSAGPFVNVTCAALPETLMESELFGHEKGAFTDAHAAKRGLVEMAAGGTLFLDEIGELTPGVQAKLLRFIEEKAYRRLGGTRDLTVDARIMAATNRDLAAEVEAGRFREDLYYRLRVVPVVLPPLRERRGDIPLLAGHFAAHYAREFAKRIGAITPDAMELLAAYRWPGNVREVRNVMERAVLLTDSETIGPRELPPEIARMGGGRSEEGAGSAPPGSLAGTERRMLVEALEKADGNQSRAAVLLGISRHQLRTRMRRHGLLAALLGLLAPLLLAVASPVAVLAQVPRAARAAGAAVSDLERRESAACDLCHGDREVLRRAAPSGWEPDSLFVTRESVAGSAHEAIPCVRCHPLPGTRPHPEQPRAAIACGTCHAEADSLWRAGPHGRAAPDGRPAASCVSCHGTHAMHIARDLHTPDGLRVLSARCVVCHEGRQLPEGDVHRDRVNCATCHGAHMIQPVEPPESHGLPIGIAEQCASCHDSVATLAWADLHGTLAREQALGLAPIAADTAPTCVACHGGHGVRPARALARELDLLERCAACHREAAEAYADTYHGRATRLEHYTAARCDDCHTGHRIFLETDQRSTVSPGLVAETCAKCHAAAARRPSFVHYRAHVVPHSPREHPAVFGAWLFMNILLGSVFTVFGLHSVFWLRRQLELRWRARKEREALGLPKPKRHHVPLDSADRGEMPYVWRFRLTHRLIHGISVISFFALIITGLPLRFSCAVWARPLVSLMGGPNVAGVIHRVAGAITILYFLAHLVDLVVTFVRTRDKKSLFWGPDSMVPQPQDFRDFVQMWKWFFGKAPHPRFPRYGYNEKFHYFGAFWGIVLLGASGLVRWFPAVATAILPGWAFNVAAIVHADEAILASGFMFLIHFFNVHMRPDKFPMDGAMFTGRIRYEELAKDHALTAESIGDPTGRPVSLKAVPDLVAPPPPRWMTYVAALFGLGALAVGLVIVGMVLWVQLC